MSFGPYFNPILGAQIGSQAIQLFGTSAPLDDFGIFGPIPPEANAATLTAIKGDGKGPTFFGMRLDAVDGSTQGFIVGMNFLDPSIEQSDPVILTNREQIMACRVFDPAGGSSGVQLCINYFTGHAGSTR